MGSTTIEIYTDIDKQSVHFIATKDNMVVGTVQYHLDTNRLRQMIIDPSYRKCGIGTDLVAKVKEESKQNGNDVLRVNSLKTAKEFYAKQGFVVQGDEYDIDEITCQWMYCKLRSK